MIKIYNELRQGSQEWLDARCGLLTASEMKHIVTEKTFALSKSEKSQQHFHELMAQRITGYVEPMYISDDMLRGIEDEVDARTLYAANYAPVTEVGFMTNDKWGFTVGYSPDGLVGDDGLIECKSRRQKYQIQTIITDAVPSEYMVQIQTGLMVSERKWCDFISYSAGLPLYVKRVMADEELHKKIAETSGLFEAALAEDMEKYKKLTAKLIKTERRNYDEEITV